MQNFINSVRLSLQTQNWYAALTVALTLPDIAGKIDYPTNPGSRARYETWYNQYLLPTYTIQLPDPEQPAGSIGIVKKKDVVFMTGNDCYALRCSFLHQGMDEIANQPARNILERFIFYVPNSNNNVNHLNFRGNTLSLQIQLFCEEIIAAIERWLADIANDAAKQQLLNNMVRLYQFLP